MINPFQEVNWAPSTEEKRKFAVSLIIGFPILAVLFALPGWFSKHAVNPSLLWMGSIGFAAGLLFWLIPGISKPFYLAWYFLSCCIGFVMGNLLFSIFFFMIVTPIGKILVLNKKLSLKKGFNKETRTYWQDVPHEKAPESYYRQF